MKTDRKSGYRRLLPYGMALVLALMLFGLAQTVQAKSSERGYLGVYIEDLDDDLRESLKFQESGGAFLDGVADDSPADEAGLEDGDIIVNFNGKDVEDEADLRLLIRRTEPGDEVTVVVFRDGDTKTYTVEMGKAADVKAFSMKGMGPHGKRMKLKMKGKACCEMCGAWLGVEIQDVSEQLGQYFKVKDGQGVMVTSVIDDSPAEKAGLKAGDVIVKIDGEATAGSADLKQAICAKKAGDAVAVELIRRGKSKNFKVELAETPEKHLSFAPRMGKFFDLECLEGLRGLKDLDIEFDADDLDELTEHLKGLHFELDEPMEELQEQLEELRQEIEKLKDEIKK